MDGECDAPTATATLTPTATPTITPTNTPRAAPVLAPGGRIGPLGLAVLLGVLVVWGYRRLRDGGA
jgi:hypothetical protein